MLVRALAGAVLVIQALLLLSTVALLAIRLDPDAGAAYFLTVFFAQIVVSPLTMALALYVIVCHRHTGP